MNAPKASRITLIGQRIGFSIADTFAPFRML